MSEKTSTGSGLDAKVVTMTPAKASALIKKHLSVVKEDDTKRNRKVSNRGIERYADDMKAGRWQLNAESIKIGEDGHIMDGQHRLLACVQANVPFQTLMVEGVAADAFASIDVGIPRTGGNLLYLAGHPSGTYLAVSLGLLWRWEKGGGKQFDQWSKSPSKPELFEVLKRHPGVEAYVQRTHNNKFKNMGSAPLMAVLWYLFAQRDAALAELFFDSLATGLNLNQDDAVYVLRERLIKDRALKPRPAMQVTADHIIRAWNATRKGEKISRLQQPRGRVGGKAVEKGREFRLGAK